MLAPVRRRSSPYGGGPTGRTALTARHGIVLGAGGVSAWALHFGVAAGLADAGLAIEDAASVVGTSAGAAVAASVLGGTTTDEALAEVLRPPPAEDRRRYLAEVREHNRGRSWWPAAPWLARHLLPGGAGPGVAWAGLAPAGVFPSSSLTRFPGLDAHDGWPASLKVVAVRLADGARVVFGHDRHDVTVADAVRASQSVPLLFSPTDIGEHRFVDGAVWSSTHADLLLETGCEVAVVVAPMCRRGPSPARALARARARDELQALTDAGVHTVALRPGPELAPLLRRVRTDPDAPAALVEAGRALVTDGLRAAGLA